MNVSKVFAIFAAAFAVIYVVAVEANLAIVTYHPRLGLWEWGVQPPRSGPAMHWYGWLITAALGASAVSLASLPLIRRRPPPMWVGWAVPLAVMASFPYFLRSYFLY